MSTKHGSPKATKTGFGRSKRQGLKGAGFAWIFGVMMVLLVAVVFLTGAVVHYDAQTTIVSRSVEAYDTVHVSEFLKRTLEGASFVNAKSAVRDLAEVGGGTPVWTNETPVMHDLETKLEKELERRMNNIDLNGLGGREIAWGSASIELEHHSETSFGFFGNKSFTVKSEVSTPQVYIENQGTFEQKIDSEYFKLLETGLDLAECPPREGSRTYRGLEVNVTNITADEGERYSVSVTGEELELKYTLKCGEAEGA